MGSPRTSDSESNLSAGSGMSLPLSGFSSDSDSNRKGKSMLTVGPCGSLDITADFFDELLMEGLKRGDKPCRIKWAYKLQPKRTSFASQLVPEIQKPSLTVSW